ncbi:hypothetical protein [Chryseobacterium sp. BIGb0232]|uniref:hypothetical protein n=1 Tax=Chryseobacterium sp. BIGb0232 TaxID=2940598 RepID=UPI000F48AB2C|nr:hypothetical protein [Chryseobacterium sp. BIGb0232]MCS4303893.1 hypothetical protein [Chryseobacterium sp. BIGb0232]ROS11568.1 hypothetical protein EDF65_3990 [Chryseobacterium nakagawai]
MKEKRKLKIWEIPITIAGLIGLFMFIHGIGGKIKGTNRTESFKVEYFIGGISILALVYFFIFTQGSDEEEEGFSLKNFNRNLIVDDIKRYHISGTIDLSTAIIESFIFGVGKTQNDYVNIFYNKNDIEFVKTKMTVEYINGDSPLLLIAYTNIDTITLRDIIQQQPSTTVYFDKYIPSDYYIDLSFLQSWEIQNKSGK